MSSSEAFKQRLKWWLFKAALLVEQRRNKAFDAKYGVDTAPEVHLGDIGVAPEDVERGNTVYRCIWGPLFHRIIQDLDIEHQRFSFVDYGSGKGKVMLLASDYPFARICGVEYAKALHDIALSNCTRYASSAQRCHDLTPVLADVLDYEPPAGPLVAFMCNPFDAHTLRSVMDRLVARAKADPSNMIVVYSNMRSITEMDDVLAHQPAFKTLVVKQNFTILSLN